VLRKDIFILPTNPTKTGVYSGAKEGYFILPTNPTKTGAYSGVKEGYIYIANETH
jgi:hypothetical protein